MRIGFISVNDKPTCELACGGTEVFVTALAKELANRGHEIFIFASGDSEVSGVKLVKATHTSLAEIQNELKVTENFEMDPYVREYFSTVLCLRNISVAKQYEDQIDIFHDNTGNFVVGTTLDMLSKPVVSTLHMPISEVYQHDIISQYVTHPNTHYVAISKYQQAQFKGKTHHIYNGIETLNPSHPVKTHHDLIWIGRIDPMTPKGLDHAILAAKATNKTLSFVGFIENDEYYNQTVAPLLDETTIHLPQFNSLQEKADFYYRAKVSVIPLQCEESFGFTLVESMSVGTPVIAYAKGAAAEVIEDGVTGFIVNASDDDIRGEFMIKETGIKGLEEAIRKIYSLTESEYEQMRINCQKRVKQHFTISKMADQYEQFYATLINKTE